MSENKRFTIERKDMAYAKIRDNGKDLTSYFFVAQARCVCDELNKLSEENEQLKSQLNEMIQLFNDSGLDYHIGDELEEVLE